MHGCKVVLHFLFFSFLCSCFIGKGLPGGSAGKESACILETWVRSLGWEDPLEKGKATHSNILTWRIVHGVAKTQTGLSDFHFHWKGTLHSRSNYKNKGNTERRNNKKSVKYFIT